jgi:hypothetical protein
MTDHNRLKILLKDCASGFYQQMYFWGKDVSHPKGNQLEAYGFTKSPSRGLTGTSCYTYESQTELIELYGSCAGYYSSPSNIVFLRQRNRFYEWLPEQKLVAGCWSQKDLHSRDADDMFSSLAPFLEWWLSYEQWILDLHGKDYREQCLTDWNKVNSKLTWLDPESAVKWIKGFLEKKDLHIRPKHFN